MRTINGTVRKLAVTAAATGLATSLALVAQPAAATSIAAPTATPAKAGQLAQQLGAESAGSYVDASGRPVVTITDPSDAARVRSAGATPKLVRYGAADLAAVTTSLGRTTKIAGTAWAVDPRTNKVVVSLDRTITGAKLTRVESAVAKFGDRAAVRRVAGTFSLRLSGGDAIYGGQYRCSLGFNVRSGSTGYFLTAGHCGNIASSWYADGAHTQLLGDTAGSSFPGDDYAIVAYSGGAAGPSDVDLYNGSTQPITGAADAYVGEYVARSGSTTGVHTGTVQAVNATVNYAEGSVYGLIQTDVCAEGGDSGGSLFDGSTALGLTSGGSGNCTFGGQTFFQPVTEALAVYGVTLP